MRRLPDGRMGRALVLLARPCVIAALCLPGLAGCASESSTGGGRDSATSAATAAPAKPASVTIQASETARARPAGKPETDAAPRTRSTPRFVSCDPNISVRAATTTCAFAQNVFYSFFKDAATDERNNAIDAYSPATRQRYALSCTTAAAKISCLAGDGGEVRFRLAALLAYDDEQADSYASTHNLGPNRHADPSSERDADRKSDAPLDDESSSADPRPSYGNEIPNYDEGRGYRVQCGDGMYSKSGGIQGACSGHGGLGSSSNPSLRPAPSYRPPAPSYRPTSPSSGGTVHVDGYTRKDGTYVQPYTRRAPCSYC